MRPSIIFLIGFVIALWMSAGRWLFGIGGSLTLWYVPTFGLAYVLAHAWIANRVALTRTKGQRTSRGTIVALVASWIVAVAFGFMVPDLHNGSLTTIASHFTGSDTALEMAIAFSNFFGIVSLALAGTAVGFSISDSRDPRPVEEEPDGPIPMPKHPLA